MTSTATATIKCQNCVGYGYRSSRGIRTTCYYCKGAGRIAWVAPAAPVVQTRTAAPVRSTKVCSYCHQFSRELMSSSTGPVCPDCYDRASN